MKLAEEYELLLREVWWLWMLCKSDNTIAHQRSCGIIDVREKKENEEKEKREKVKENGLEQTHTSSNQNAIKESLGILSIHAEEGDCLQIRFGE